MSRPSFRRVPEAELRERFNRLGYVEKATSGEVAVFCERDEPIEVSFLPAGSRSQVLHYYTLDLKIKLAVVHQYLRPDGSLGASGRPDPKLVYEDNVIYAKAR
jgi:hypothetical protein